MKLQYAILLVLLTAALTTGCGSSVGDANVTENAPKINQQDEQAVIPPENCVIADDNYSNLQLADANTPVFDKRTLWERQEQGLTMELPEIKPYHSEKIAYLTFDDGPDNKNTPAILDVLKNYGVHATFYVCGNMVEANPNVLKRIYAEGHAIGNHSYNHKYNELYPSATAFLVQIANTDEIIHEVIGVRPLTIRTPGGRVGMWTADYPPMMKACGYVEHDWNVSCEDATAQRPNPQQIIANIDWQTNSGFKDNAAIILMHCNEGKENTVSALPAVIELLVNKGYKFGVVTPMTPQPW